jgi:hypothetical protein
MPVGVLVMTEFFALVGVIIGVTVPVMQFVRIMRLERDLKAAHRLLHELGRRGVTRS